MCNVLAAKYKLIQQTFKHRGQLLHHVTLDPILYSCTHPPHCPHHRNWAWHSPCRLRFQFKPALHSRPINKTSCAHNRDTNWTFKSTSALTLYALMPSLGTVKYCAQKLAAEVVFTDAQNCSCCVFALVTVTQISDFNSLVLLTKKLNNVMRTNHLKQLSASVNSHLLHTFTHVQ